MRKYFAAMLLFLLILTGCSNQNAEPDVGDFSFDMPAGYAITDIADLNCVIIRSDNSAVAGGIELTSFSRRDVIGKKTDTIMRYLQEEFHQTYDVEYIATHWGNKNKILSVNLKKNTPAGQTEAYSHYFFERYECIYHIWLDMDVVDPEMEKIFLVLTGVD